MAKGLAVIQGANKVVFKALENGIIQLGTESVSAAVYVKGSLKLDLGSQDEGFFLKSDADGNATWAKIAASDVSGLESIESDVSAVSAALVAEIDRATTREDGIATDLSGLRSEFDLITGDFDVNAVLKDLETIQEYLDGDGDAVSALTGAVGRVGDITNFVETLSSDISALEENQNGNFEELSQALSVEELTRADADAQLSSDLSAEAVARAEGDAGLSSDLSAEAVARAAADAELSSDLSELSSDLSAEAVARAAADAELSSDLSSEASTRLSVDTLLSEAIEANLASGIVDVQGVANETDVTITNDPNGGKVATVGLADDVIITGSFQIPKYNRAQAKAKYPDDGTDYNGHMIYVADVDAENDDFSQGNKWYFHENGEWHASFFYVETP